MNRFIDAIDRGIKVTENGATAYSTTLNKVYDMFAFGGAYRGRPDADCIVLFNDAYAEDPTMALKCLFYNRDARGGQGERRFFRVCLRWLANNNPEVVIDNFDNIAFYGRWDDFYSLLDTKVEHAAMEFLKNQFMLDLNSPAPSLLAKWLKSENTSSAISREQAKRTRMAFGMSSKQYRKALSTLRAGIRIVESFMSAGRWNEIEYDTLPSKAGLIYKNAFARHDHARYAEFMFSDKTKVNAKTLYPYEVVNQAMNCYASERSVERVTINKYWENLADYFNDMPFNGLAMVDVSGSMSFGYAGNVRPLDVAVSLGLYTAEKNHGIWKNRFLTFSYSPQFVTVKGADFVDKVRNISRAQWGMNTNLVKAFDLILNTARRAGCTQDEIPQNLIVISDMEIDSADTGSNSEMEYVRKEYERCGYKMPHLIYWNVNARNNTILDGNDNTTFVSGCSPVIFEQVLKGVTGMELMLDKLNSERYSRVKG